MSCGALPAKGMIDLHEYVVSEGDSIRSISEKFGVDGAAVARLNGGVRALRRGQMLRIPVFSLYTRLRRGQSKASAAAALQVPPSRVRGCGAEIYVFFE